jgi:signal transduction histidine kinase/ActR/RegA family two-component response regulator
LIFDLAMRRIAPYGASVLVIGAAALARAGLAPFLGDHYPLGTFYAAVAIIGWYWGVGPAVLAAILGYLVGDYLFLSPQGSPKLFVLELTAYGVICAGIIALVYRVSERQRRLDRALAAQASAQHALAESDTRFEQARQRLEVVTNAMSVGVAQCNRQFEYVWANPAYERGFSLAAGPIESLHGRKIEAVLGSEAFERFVPHFQRVLGGETVEYEGPSGSGIDPNRWIHATYTPIWNDHPSPAGWVAVISDLTERRALEDQLRQSNRRKDEFLATLAHELRNPLAPIRYASQLMKPGTPPEMAADARRMIDRQLAHMARLLDDLLDVSRITRGTLEIRRDAVDLRAVLRHAVEAARPLVQAVEHELQVQVPELPLVVRGDETRLIQVIGNLINNAMKFTNAGGAIVVSADIDGSMIVARVRDTGRGISPDLLPHVFEMFIQGDSTARQTGLGIGLALAKQMVELHGGRIEAHSDGPGRGSEFRVLLPCAAEIPAMQESPTDLSNLSVLGADRVRILIVDDNVDAADSLAQFLKLAGYQTRVAYDGRTAVEMAEILEPAVVLLDLGLPHLNGHEVARRLRALPWGRSAVLIALTGWGQADDVQRSRQAGFDEHLTKPVDPEVLLQHIIGLTRGEAQTGS